MITEWQPIETAPKDGTCVFLLSKSHETEDGDGNIFHHRPRCSIGYWNKDGTSWVDEFGNMDGVEVCTLAATGVWYSGGGWFQPNEVSHWMPLPAPPMETKP